MNDRTQPGTQPGAPRTIFDLFEPPPGVGYLHIHPGGGDMGDMGVIRPQIAGIGQLDPVAQHQLMLTVTAALRLLAPPAPDPLVDTLTMLFVRPDAPDTLGGLGARQQYPLASVTPQPGWLDCELNPDTEAFPPRGYEDTYAQVIHTARRNAVTWLEQRQLGLSVAASFPDSYHVFVPGVLDGQSVRVTLPPEPHCIIPNWGAVQDAWAEHGMGGGTLDREGNTLTLSLPEDDVLDDDEWQALTALGSSLTGLTVARIPWTSLGRLNHPEYAARETLRQIPLTVVTYLSDSTTKPSAS